MEHAPISQFLEESMFQWLWAAAPHSCRQTLVDFKVVPCRRATNSRLATLQLEMPENFLQQLLLCCKEVQARFWRQHRFNLIGSIAKSASNSMNSRSL